MLLFSGQTEKRRPRPICQGHTVSQFQAVSPQVTRLPGPMAPVSVGRANVQPGGIQRCSQNHTCICHPVQPLICLQSQAKENVALFSNFQPCLLMQSEINYKHTALKRNFIYSNQPTCFAKSSLCLGLPYCTPDYGSSLPA